MTWVELFLVGCGCGGLSGKKVSQEEIQSKLSQARQGVETFGSTSTKYYVQWEEVPLLLSSMYLWHDVVRYGSYYLVTIQYQKFLCDEISIRLHILNIYCKLHLLIY